MIANRGNAHHKVSYIGWCAWARVGYKTYIETNNAIQTEAEQVQES